MGMLRKKGGLNWLCIITMLLNVGVFVCLFVGLVAGRYQVVYCASLES